MSGPASRAVLLCVLPVLLLSCGRGEKTYERAGLVMGTVVEIKVVASSGAAASRALDAAFSELEAVDEAMSAYREGSDIARINASAGGPPVPVGPRTIEVLREATRMSALSGGAFDITVGPLLDLWGFRAESFRVPESGEIEALLAGSVGSDKIEIDAEEGTVRLARPGMEIDLGGIAKGYGADRAARALGENGAARGLVNVGGDLSCLGERAWRIGIRHPRESGKLIARLTVVERAVATSGDYESYFISGGRRYSHIIDARSGRPADTDVLSVTVVAGSCVLADPVATTVFILGAEEGMALVEGMDGVDAVVVVDGDGAVELLISSGLKDKVEAIDRNVRKGG